MARRSLFDSFLVGKKRISSRIKYKQAVLRGQLALLLFAVCLFYIIVDSINGLFLFVPYYFIGTIIATLVIYLNRIKKYTLASTILLLVANILIFIIAVPDNPDSGVFFFFMATSVAALVLFYHDSLNIGLLFVGFSILLGLIAYFNDFDFLVREGQTESLMNINFIVNFILGILSSVLVVLFIIKRNIESEASLMANKDQLEHLTKELESSKNRFSLALEGTKAGIYEYDINKDRVYVSARWKHLLGLGDDDLKPDLQFFLNLIHPEDKNRVAGIIEKAFAKGTSYQYEVRLMRKGHGYTWFFDSGITSVKKGKSTAAVGSIIDINDRKLAEESLKEKNIELQKANDELDSFVYSASHDMRAPLSTLLGLINIAKLSTNPKDYTQYFDMMTSRIHDMEGFIREVTDYSRNARLKVEYRNVDLKEMIKNLSSSFKFLADESDVSINLHFEDCRKIKTDITRLNVVLNNLISNAIKYHDPRKDNRFVKVSGKANDKSCYITIEDNGLGIVEEYQDKIFDMFYRASENSNGSGLGLYIVKETLEKINGRISFESKPMAGSKFVVELPIGN
jgi:PAS domain S-box-containing protein